MTEQIQEAITLFSQEELALIREILEEIDAEQQDGTVQESALKAAIAS